LSRFKNINEVDVAGSQRSAFEKGVNTMYCNATPIAGRTSIQREVAQSAIQAIFDAVADLANIGMTLFLDFDFMQMKVDNKNMNYKYSPLFVERTASKPNFSNSVI
jgi:CCDC81 eukaryotic HU domain 2